MRLKLFLPILWASIYFLPQTAQAQVGEDAEAIFSELRALDGTWFMPTDRGDRLEIWRVLNDSTYAGKNVRIKPENGDTVLLETIRLELRDTNITYIATARGQNNNKPVYYRLTSADTDGYVFENPKHDDPKLIRYRLLSNREIQVTTEGDRNGRPTKQEFVFEREFTPSSVEFRARAGANYHNMRRTGFFNTQDGPAFSGAPAGEVGATAVFKGRGGYISINMDLALTLKRASTKSAFIGDTTSYVRDLSYNSAWLTLAVVPEFTFRRDGRFSVMAGPYIGRLMGNSTSGTQNQTDNLKLRATNDLKKTDFGLTAGFQYKINFGKKDVGGILGARLNYGLSNIDNLYDRACESNPALCNGRVSLQGASLYYSFNLLKL
jgi:hypothetical protein